MIKWPEHVIARLPLPEGYCWQDETAAIHARIRHDRAAAPGFVTNPSKSKCAVYTVKFVPLNNVKNRTFRPEYELAERMSAEDAARYLYHFTLFVYEPKEYP